MSGGSTVRNDQLATLGTQPRVAGTEGLGRESHRRVKFMGFGTRLWVQILTSSLGWGVVFDRI